MEEAARSSSSGQQRIMRQVEKENEKLTRKRGRSEMAMEEGVVKRACPPTGAEASVASLPHGALGQGAWQPSAGKCGNGRFGGADTQETSPGETNQSDSSG